MLKLFESLLADAMCGGLSALCCILIEEFLRVRDDMSSLSHEEIRQLYRVACACACKTGTPQTSDENACDKQLSEVTCSPSGISAMKTLDTLLTPIVDFPIGGMPAPPTLKTLRDVARSLVSVCEKKEPVTAAHLTTLCSAWESAKASLGTIPGGMYIWNKMADTSLGKTLETCCKARIHVPPPPGQPGPGGVPAGNQPPPPPAQQQSTVARLAPYAGAAIGGAYGGPAGAAVGYYAGGAAGSVVDGLF